MDDDRVVIERMKDQPDRKVFKIDTRGLSPAETLALVKQYKALLRGCPDPD